MEYANDILISNIRISMLKMIEPSHKLEEIIGKFSKDQLKLIMENVGAIQLTEGCNSCCPDCGVGALPKVRDYIPFDFLKYLFSEFKNELNKQVPLLYFASEPFDYNDGTHTYIDVHNMFEKKCHANPTVVTSVPIGWEKTILSYVLNNNSLGNVSIYKGNLNGNGSKFINAISITRLNSQRVEKTLYELLPELNPENQIKIKSKYKARFCDKYSEIDEDGIISRYSINTKRLVLTNFEEISDRLGLSDATKFYLNGINNTTTLTSETKVKLDENNCLFTYIYKHGRPNKKTADQIMKRSEKVKEQLNAQKRYFSISTNNIGKNTEGQLYIVPLSNGDYLAEESHQVSFSHLFNYLFFRDQSIVRDFRIREFRNPDRPKQIHDRKLGPNNINNLAPEGIGCFHGVVITPKGIFNRQTRKPSKDYPYGQKVMPIDPNNFSVANYYYLSSFNDIVTE